MPDISIVFKNFPDNNFKPVNKLRLIKELHPNVFFAVIEIIPMKGNGYGIRWGFLIKFIPRISKSRFNLEKSCLDLSYDPIDYANNSQEYIASDENELIKLEAKLEDEILKYFKDVHGWMNLFHIYQDKISKKAVRFNFENYPQEKYAYEKLTKRLARL